MQRLWDAGYEMEFVGGQFLLVHHIPYVNREREVRFGSIVCVLTPRTPMVFGPMDDHTIRFIGETPCHVDGRHFNEIIINSSAQQLAPGLTVNFQFSSKPKGTGVYPDYFEKVHTYAEMLSAPARAIDPQVTARPRKEVVK
jgi:hypothetical protein